MAVPDPRWLEILKASGWQTFAIALASALFFVGIHVGLLPKPPDWVTLFVGFAFLLCAALALTGLVSSLFQFLNVRGYVVELVQRRGERKALAAYIPHMTAIEREILGYLLARNQKTLVGDQDGGKAIVSHTFLSEDFRRKEGCASRHD
jgi:hypothetical protein